ncbi:MAG: single-stranded DNA-binding protein [Legionellales bacterium]|nr:single-stranded DNA-binding protein [Legionellales bacterium]
MALTNDVRLIGYCGTFPKVKTYKDGRKICRLPVYTEHWSYQTCDGQRQQIKELHWCVFFGRNAERAEQLLMKGSQIHIRGTIHYHKKAVADRVEVMPQILVDEFMISTKATVTKELYDYIFNEENTKKESQINNEKA